MYCRHFGYHAVSGVPTQAYYEPKPPKGILSVLLVGLIITLGLPHSKALTAECLVFITIYWSLASNFKGSAFNRTHSNSHPMVWRCIRPSFIGGSGLRLSTEFQIGSHPAGRRSPTQFHLLQLCLLLFSLLKLFGTIFKVSFEVFLQGTSIYWHTVQLL